MSDAVSRTEILQPGPAQGLSGLFEVPYPDHGELPLLWHWIYLLDRPAQGDLGPDGHPIRNTVPLPPGPGLRRMWAGGQVVTHGALRLGVEATRHTEVREVREKQGRTGTLTFVTVGHRIVQDGRTVIDERQDLVYRTPVRGAQSAEESGTDQPAGPEERVIEVTPTLLFRFSALTYNAHRIHYDRDYARGAEGYPGLLVHGPLQLLLLAELARAHGSEGDRILDYRLHAPLFDNQGLIVGTTWDAAERTLTVRDRTGRTTATATLRPAD